MFHRDSEDTGMWMGRICGIQEYRKIWNIRFYEDSRVKLQRILKYSRILKDFDYDVLFRDHTGVSVFVKTEYAKKILKILNREIKPDTGKSLFTRCPRYDRVLEKGFVIETIKIWKRKEDEIIDIGRKIEKEIKCLKI